jgi:hypothetical protein
MEFLVLKSQSDKSILMIVGSSGRTGMTVVGLVREAAFARVRAVGGPESRLSDTCNNVKLLVFPTSFSSFMHSSCNLESTKELLSDLRTFTFLMHITIDSSEKHSFLHRCRTQMIACRRACLQLTKVPIGKDSFKL